MIYLAAFLLIGWLLYSVPIGIGLASMCVVMSLFYCAAIGGEADDKVSKTFLFLVILMSLIMMGVVNEGPTFDGDMPKMCNHVEC